jgi:hypothetical protein
MARRYSSIGLFGIFGRSADLRQFDNALRSLDLHPRLVPEAVKLAAVALLRNHAIGPEPAPQSYRAAAEIVCYCMIGEDAFAGANDAALAGGVERRIEAALEQDEALDAQLLLLLLHAKIIQPDVVGRFALETVTRS